MTGHTQQAPPPGSVPRTVRLGSFLLSVLLTVLFVWLLGFVLDDIGDVPGPDFQDVASEYVDASLRERELELQQSITEIETQVARQAELQKDLGRSMDNARGTMQQMMELHRLSLEREVPPTQAEQEALASAQQRFLRAQDRFETANAEIAASNESKFQLGQELQSTLVTLEQEERPARLEYQERLQAHRFKVASLKLVFIVPVFLLAAWLFARWRTSAYRSVLLAFLVATFWMLGRVMFDHFPREFFKYIAIVSGIAIVLAFLIWLLRKAVKPDRRLLLDRYREAYRAHVCPVCTFPIARGPLRFALWTRKGPRLPAGIEPEQSPASATPYACPSCGTTLFAPCRVCEAPRHTLLPFCEHCADELESAAACAGPAVP